MMKLVRWPEQLVCQQNTPTSLASQFISTVQRGDIARNILVCCVTPCIACVGTTGVMYVGHLCNTIEEV